ncbi:thiamine pyrophosphokinase [Colletotrichum orchidophilum]|uniref:Thiamine pyrophosphokinase n=1 Tax=Colletotrichum orchidophilum TaxID=1209926 RepID=A0A1G4BE68_9PEZI|nr:thiamine pyrophosphokinase [Colletotrichum orchidophilum]OHE99690.1 thiamine pyrophosphokinase [Colletotrichum orchidophilum]
MSTHTSLLKLVETNNKFKTTDEYVEFGYLHGNNWRPLGIVSFQNAQHLRQMEQRLDRWLAFPQSSEGLNRIQLKPDHLKTTETFINAFMAIREVLTSEGSGLAKQNLGEYGNEMWPLYGADIETGFLCGLAPVFGIVTTGVHLNIYKRNGDDPKDFRIWVARRSDSKPTFPGKYDQCAAGGYQFQLRSEGLVYGEVHDTSAFKCLQREVKEEIKAGLPRGWDNSVKEASAIQFADVRDKRWGNTHLHVPELGVKVTYDLELWQDCKFVGNPEEVKNVEVKTVGQIVDLLLRDEFKPNSALVMVDFLIRHDCLKDSPHASTEQIQKMQGMLKRHEAVDRLPHWTKERETPKPQR